jgi:translation initiation factor IF-3
LRLPETISLGSNRVSPLVTEGSQRVGPLLFKEDCDIATKQQQRINEQIRVSQVRVVDADGTQLGIISTEEALATARNAGLDLVEVAPESKPPVCRVMDYGKFKYQQKKRQHKSHTHQHKVKEIRVRPKTGDHDINVKVNRARTFLEHKDKVLISVMFRGREITHVEEGHRVITQMLEQLEDVSKVESAPSRQGRRIICTLAPK